MREKNPIRLSDDARKRATASLKRYVAENLDEEIGDLKATLFLDYILAEHGPAIYNQAIGDAKSFMEERVADLGAVFFRAEFSYWDNPTRGQ